MLGAVVEVAGQFEQLHPEYLQQSMSPIDHNLTRTESLLAIVKFSRCFSAVFDGKTDYPEIIEPPKDKGKGASV